MSPKIYFILQIGSPTFLKVLDVTKFGNISFDRYNPSFGFVCFQATGAFSCANNVLLPITTSQVKCASFPSPASSPDFALRLPLLGPEHIGT